MQCHRSVASAFFVLMIVATATTTMTIQYKNLYRTQWSTVVESEAWAVAGRAKGGLCIAGS